MKKQAIPYRGPGGQRILFPGYANFGRGSFNEKSRCHTGVLTGNKIGKRHVQVHVTDVFGGRVVSESQTSVVYTGIELNLYEN